MTHFSEVSGTSIPRDFKGIWIPREIWLDKRLGPNEKILWAEIHSLHDREKGGCYASNEYLCNFLQVKERALQVMLAHLKKIGLLEQVAFDGRIRILRAISPEDAAHQKSNKTQNITPQRCKKMHPLDAKKCTPSTKAHTYTERKDERKDDDDRAHKEPKKDGPINTKGEPIEIDESSIFSHMTKFDYPTEVVQQAIQRLKEQPGPFFDINRYIETTCKGIMSARVSTIANDSRKKKSSEKHKTDYAPPKNEAPTISWAEMEEILRKEEQHIKNSQTIEGNKDASQT